MSLRPTVMALATCTLVGCVQTVRFPPDLWPDDGLDGFEEGGRIDDGSVDLRCGPEESWWTGGFSTVGWSGTATIDLVQGPRAERHDARLLGSDPEGQWDQFQIGPLTGGVPFEEQVSGESSTFDCAVDVDEIDFVILVRNRGDALIDCVWGSRDFSVEPELLFDDEIDEIGGCRWLTR